MRLPFIFEAWESDRQSNLQVCRKMMKLLLRNKVSPLPFASTLKEMTDVLKSLNSRNVAPSVFIINTYWAEELLLPMDPLIGDVPTLFFRRELSSDKKIIEILQENPGYGNTSAALSCMSPRLSTVWKYGALTSDAIAERATHCLLQFLQDGEFRKLENHRIPSVGLLAS